MTQKFDNLDWFPDIRALRYFVAVAEEKSVTRASARLRIAQPAVSRQIAGLEADLNTILFNRLPRGVELTESGMFLLDRCYRVFADLSQTYRDITAQSASPKGTVVVGMPPTPGEFIVPPLLARITADYPDIELCFVEGFSRELEKALIRGNISIAVMHDPPVRSDIVQRDLLVENLKIVGPPGSLSAERYTLKDVGALPLIMPSRPNFLRILFDRACDGQNVRPDIVQRVDGTGHLKALVRAGHGFTILTHGGVLTEVSNGTLEARMIVDPQISWTLSIASRDAHGPRVATAAVEAAIYDIVTDLMSRGIWR